MTGKGCLSFFDVRGLVPRPLHITVETTALDGTTVTMVYERGLARLISHEIDHLDGLLYFNRMRTGVEPIPVEQYRQTGRSWAYDSCPGIRRDNTGDVDAEDPATWDDLFVRDVDERPVQFVRPADADRPTWAAYEAGAYLGTVSAKPDGGGSLWRVQTAHEAHRNLDDWSARCSTRPRGRASASRPLAGPAACSPTTRPWPSTWRALDWRARTRADRRRRGTSPRSWTSTSDRHDGGPRRSATAGVLRLCRSFGPVNEPPYGRGQAAGVVGGSGISSSRSHRPSPSSPGRQNRTSPVSSASYGASPTARSRARSLG